jgi:hypothetical protein
MTYEIGVRSEQDAALASEARAWLARRVNCLFARREFAMERYCIAIVETPEEFEVANTEFLAILRQGLTTACLYIYRDQERAKAMSAGQAIRTLFAMLPEPRGGWRRQGHSVAQSVELLCPVTRLMTTFPDFDCVGFYPHADDKNDPHYDPSNHAPFICINQTSDLFGCARMTGDLIDGRGPIFREQMKDHTVREALFAKAQRIWQDLAVRTIQGFGAAADAALVCPPHLSKDHNYYVIEHDESNFMDIEKNRHISEMPALYMTRIVAEWERAMETGNAPILRNLMRPAMCPFHVSNRERPEQRPHDIAFA